MLFGLVFRSIDLVFDRPEIDWIGNFLTIAWSLFPRDWKCKDLFCIFCCHISEENTQTTLEWQVFSLESTETLVDTIWNEHTGLVGWS